MKALFRGTFTNIGGMLIVPGRYYMLERVRPNSPKELWYRITDAETGKSRLCPYSNEQTFADNWKVE